MGWGHWDHPVGPSTFVPGYVAEDLDRLRRDGRLALLVDDARRDGAISRAATRLADIHSSVDADLKLAESVRTLELVFQGSGIDWRKAAKNQLAEVWGALKRQLSDVIYRRLLADERTRQAVRGGQTGVKPKAA